MIERLYRAYFTEQRSVFDLDSLVGAGRREAGLDATEARETLESERYVDAVARDLDEARSLGVTGVPFFVIDGRYGISGAQATEVFARALAAASGREPEPGPERYNVLTRTFLNFTVPAPYWSAIGPRRASCRPRPPSSCR